MKTKINIFILILLFSIFIYVFYYALSSNTKNNPQVMVNKKLPNIELTSLFDQEKKISLPAKSKDLFYIINIWASWCVPCRDEHSFLMRLKDEQKIQIYGINYKDSNSNAILFLKNLGNPFYFVGLDGDGKNSIELGAYGVPETYIVNSSGIIIFKHVGPINESIYLKIIEIIK